MSKPVESFEELVENEVRNIRDRYALTEDEINEGASAKRWFDKARDEHGSDILRPKKASLKERFSVRRAPGNKWAVDDAKTNDSAAFKALDEVAQWIEDVSRESIE